MGRLHYKPARYVDSRVRSDSKLLKWIKLYPIIYDKSHRLHRNRAEREQIWEYIASNLHKTANKCKERWYYLVKQYKECQNVLTLHDILIELLDNCFKRLPKVPDDPNVGEIEDDILSQLFSESVEREIESSSYSDCPLRFEDSASQSRMLFNFSADSGLEPDLMDESYSLPFETSFNATNNTREDMEEAESTENLYNTNNSISEDFIDFDYNNLRDILYQEDENIDDYYNYFVQNILADLYRYPLLFGDIVNSLIENMNEEASTEVRKELVKMVCDRLKNYKTQSRQ